MAPPGVARLRADQGLGLVVAVFATVVLVSLLYYPTVVNMVTMWSLSTYEYCWLVLPISLVLIWRRRAELAAVSIRPSVAGVATLAGLVALWWLASMSGVQVVESFAVAWMVPAVFWAVFGGDAVRRILFPLLFLSALVPVGEAWIPPLMRATADISSFFLGALGTPVYRDGMILTLPGGVFEVAAVCSGLQYLLAGTVASTLFGYVAYSSYRKRVLFVVATVVVFVLANGLRAGIVMFVASATDLRWLAGEDHVVFGLVLFAAVLVLMLWIGNRFADHPAEKAAPPASTGLRPSVAACAAVVALLAAGPYVWAQRTVDPGAANTMSAMHLAHCAPPGEWRAPWRPSLIGAPDVVASSYDCGGHVLDLFRATYAGQGRGRELVNASNAVWPEQWQRHAAVSSVDLDVGGRTVTVRQVLARGSESTVMLWYWYEIGDEVTGSEFRAKWLEVVRIVTRRGGRSSLIVCAVEGTESAAVLSERLLKAATEILTGVPDGESGHS